MSSSGADLGLVAEHAAGDVRVAAGEVVEVRLELAEASRWKRVRSGSPRAISSVKNDGAAPSQP